MANTPTVDDPSLTPAFVLGGLALLFALTPALPIGLALALLGIRRALGVAPSPRRSWALGVCIAGLSLSILAVPWFLMFVDTAGVFR